MCIRDRSENEHRLGEGVRNPGGEQLHASRVTNGTREGPGLRITVLGKSPSWQDADGACSGYLIEEGSTTVLLDCGNGVFSKLRKYRDYVRVDAVVISHPVSYT